MKRFFILSMLLAFPSLVFANTVINFSNTQGGYSSQNVTNSLPADTYVEFGYKFETQYPTLLYSPLFNWKYIPNGYNGTDNFFSFYNYPGDVTPVGVKISRVDGAAFTFESFSMLGNGQGWMLKNNAGTFFSRTVNNHQLLVFDASFNGMAAGIPHVAEVKTYSLSDLFQNITWAEFVPLNPVYADKMFLQTATFAGDPPPAPPIANPEPATMLLMGIGVLGVACLRKRMRPTA